MQLRLTQEMQTLKQKRSRGVTARRDIRILEELRMLARRTEADLRPSQTTRDRLRRIQERVVDEVRFLRQWAESPLKTGAVAPSGQELSRLMAGYVELDRPGVIVELGPGTGAVTQALVDRGVPQERLLLIEYSPEFCTLLRERFPGATVMQGNAYALGEVLAEVGQPPVASVVSGLPLFTRPLPERQALLSAAMAAMAPGAPFIQFSYALVPAVQGLVGITWSTSRWVLANLPPARVWAYRSEAERAAIAA
ncbi:class I SAM-dependent methyltransferase [Acuticoccus sp. I52.16.1]|uniref:class I SAM-dependent methyltransferase n=1 Tax=Acuticoccus sp. I52.16.1 TaxID=2928472 RepID=UPI00352DEAF5